ncbi:MAG: winged helix-turn-helix transcriptional regulator [Elusimicrobia bacterium]|nr:winged helix-turn-helix transcriptional regulator [Elusimicrobiota bacterium]
MNLHETQRLLNILAEPNRLRLLIALSSRRLCVCELSAALKLRQTVVSQHLRVLRDCDLVVNHKDGLWVEYEVSPEALQGPPGRLLKAVLTEAGRDDAVALDQQAVAEVDRKVVCRKPKGTAA